ncbi:hypothetical protein NDU88_003179 [Pleurodeles waltl]|uniref:Uncharacterized protein n=1 Tax=Pleurodeles waltl TaxID=8319 RepID=A0AAV7PHG0_PLEWA|nr:hypothetical protein NDU88_003179 [Pleurodeles waltl]
MEPELQILPAIVFLLLYQEHERRQRRPRDFPFGGWIPHALESRAEVFSRRMDANKPCYTQIVRLAFLDAAGAQEGPEGRKLDLQREGTSSKTKSPH